MRVLLSLVLTVSVALAANPTNTAPTFVPGHPLEQWNLDCTKGRVVYTPTPANSRRRPWFGVYPVASAAAINDYHDNASQVICIQNSNTSAGDPCDSPFGTPGTFADTLGNYAMSFFNILPQPEPYTQRAYTFCVFDRDRPSSLPDGGTDRPNDSQASCYSPVCTQIHPQDILEPPQLENTEATVGADELISSNWTYYESAVLGRSVKAVHFDVQFPHNLGWYRAAGCMDALESEAPPIPTTLCNYASHDLCKPADPVTGQPIANATRVATNGTRPGGNSSEAGADCPLAAQACNSVAEWTEVVRGERIIGYVSGNRVLYRYFHDLEDHMFEVGIRNGAWGVDAFLSREVVEPGVTSRDFAVYAKFGVGSKFCPHHWGFGYGTWFITVFNLNSAYSEAAFALDITARPVRILPNGTPIRTAESELESRQLSTVENVMPTPARVVRTASSSLFYINYDETYGPLALTAQASGQAVAKPLFTFLPFNTTTGLGSCITINVIAELITRDGPTLPGIIAPELFTLVTIDQTDFSGLGRQQTWVFSNKMNNIVRFCPPGSTQTPKTSPSILYVVSQAFFAGGTVATTLQTERNGIYGTIPEQRWWTETIEQPDQQLGMPAYPVGFWGYEQVLKGNYRLRCNSTDERRAAGGPQYERFYCRGSVQFAETNSRSCFAFHPQMSTDPQLYMYQYPDIIDVDSPETFNRIGYRPRINPLKNNSMGFSLVLEVQTSTGLSSDWPDWSFELLDTCVLETDLTGHYLHYNDAAPSSDMPAAAATVATIPFGAVKPQRVEPECNYELFSAMVEQLDDGEQALREGRRPDGSSLPVDVLGQREELDLLTWSGVWQGCLNLANSLLTSSEPRLSFPQSTRCFENPTIQFDNGTRIENPDYVEDPCCSVETAFSFCCAPRDKEDQLLPSQPILPKNESEINSIDSLTCDDAECVASYVEEYASFRQGVFVEQRCNDISSKDVAVDRDEFLLFYRECKREVQHSSEFAAKLPQQCFVDDDCNTTIRNADGSTFALQGICNVRTTTCVDNLATRTALEQSFWNCLDQRATDRQKIAILNRLAPLADGSRRNEYDGTPVAPLLQSAYTSLQCVGDTEGTGWITRPGFHTLYLKLPSQPTCRTGSTNLCTDELCQSDILFENQVFGGRFDSNCFYTWKPIPGLNAAACEATVTCNWNPALTTTAVAANFQTVAAQCGYPGALANGTFNPAAPVDEYYCAVCHTDLDCEPVEVMDGGSARPATQDECENQIEHVCVTQDGSVEPLRPGSPNCNNRVDGRCTVSTCEQLCNVSAINLGVGQGNVPYVSPSTGPTGMNDASCNSLGCTIMRNVQLSPSFATDMCACAGVGVVQGVDPTLCGSIGATVVPCDEQSCTQLSGVCFDWDRLFFQLQLVDDTSITPKPVTGFCFEGLPAWNNGDCGITDQNGFDMPTSQGCYRAQNCDFAADGSRNCTSIVDEAGCRQWAADAESRRDVTEGGPEFVFKDWREPGVLRGGSGIVRWVPSLVPGQQSCPQFRDGCLEPNVLITKLHTNKSESECTECNGEYVPEGLTAEWTPGVWQRATARKPVWIKRTLMQPYRTRPSIDFETLSLFLISIWQESVTDTQLSELLCNNNVARRLIDQLSCNCAEDGTRSDECFSADAASGAEVNVCSDVASPSVVLPPAVLSVPAGAVQGSEQTRCSILEQSVVSAQRFRAIPPVLSLSTSFRERPDDGDRGDYESVFSASGQDPVGFVLGDAIELSGTRAVSNVTMCLTVSQSVLSSIFCCIDRECVEHAAAFSRSTDEDSDGIGGQVVDFDGVVRGIFRKTPVVLRATGTGGERDRLFKNSDGVFDRYVTPTGDEQQIQAPASSVRDMNSDGIVASDFDSNGEEDLLKELESQTYDHIRNPSSDLRCVSSRVRYNVTTFDFAARHSERSGGLLPLYVEEATYDYDTYSLCGRVDIAETQADDQPLYAPIYRLPDEQIDNSTGLQDYELGMFIWAAIMYGILSLIGVSAFYANWDPKNDYAPWLADAILFVFGVFRCVYFSLLAADYYNANTGENAGEYVLAELPTFLYMSIALVIGTTFLQVYFKVNSPRSSAKKFHLANLAGISVIVIFFLIVLIVFLVTDTDTTVTCGGRRVTYDNSTINNLRIAYRAIVTIIAFLFSIILIASGTRLYELMVQAKMAGKPRKILMVMLVTSLGLAVNSLCFLIYFIVDQPTAWFVFAVVATEFVPLAFVEYLRAWKQVRVQFSATISSNSQTGSRTGHSHRSTHSLQQSGHGTAEEV